MMKKITKFVQKFEFQLTIMTIITLAVLLAFSIINGYAILTALLSTATLATATDFYTQMKERKNAKGRN